MDHRAVLAKDLKLRTAAIDGSLRDIVSSLDSLDATIAQLVLDIASWSGVCEVVSVQLQLYPSEEEAQDCPDSLRVCIDNQLGTWKSTIEQLEAATQNANKSSKKKASPLSNTWIQIKRHMQVESVGDARDRIQQHSNALCLVSQMILIEALCKQQNRPSLSLELQAELTRLSDLRQEVEKRRHKQSRIGTGDGVEPCLSGDEEILVACDQVKTRAKELSMTGQHSNRIFSPSNPSWLECLRTVARLGRRDPGMSTAPPSDSNAYVHVQTVQVATQAGREAFQKRLYGLANGMLQEAVKSLQKLPEEHQQIVCDPYDILFMLGVCSFNLRNFGAAQSALLLVIEESDKPSNARVLGATHYLASVYLELGDMEQATDYGERALRGRQRSLGKQHASTYKSVALMAQIWARRGDQARAMTLANELPTGEEKAQLIKQLNPEMGRTSGQEISEPIVIDETKGIQVTTVSQEANGGLDSSLLSAEPSEVVTAFSTDPVQIPTSEDRDFTNKDEEPAVKDSHGTKKKRGKHSRQKKPQAGPASDEAESEDETTGNPYLDILLEDYRKPYRAKNSTRDKWRIIFGLGDLDAEASGGFKASKIARALFINRKEVALNYIKDLVKGKVPFREAYEPRPGDLHLAALFGDRDVFYALLETWADTKAPWIDGLTPLHCAAIGGMSDIAERLLNAGADVNSISDTYGTPVGLAVFCGRIDVIGLLLRNGADISLRGGLLGSPIHAAVCNADDVQLIQAICEDEDADIDTEGFYSLKLAAKLFQATSPLEVESDKLHERNYVLECSPIGLAVNYGQEEIFSFLISRKAKIEPPTYLYRQDRDGSRPSDRSEGVCISLLNDAATSGYHAILEGLLQHGANFPAEDDVLRETMEAEHDSCVELLLEHGCHISEEALSGAAFAGRTDLVKSMVQRNVSENIRNKVTERLITKRDARTPLSEESLATLVASVPPCRRTDCCGPLIHVAVKYNDTFMVKHLLDAGEDINARGSNGSTPLMSAIQSREPALVSLLLERGAAVDLVDESGRNATYYAEKSDKLEIKELVASKSDNRSPCDCRACRYWRIIIDELDQAERAGSEASGLKNASEIDEKLTQLISINDKNHLLLALRSFYGLKLSLLDRSLADLTRAVELQPTFRLSSLCKGLLSYGLGRLPDALDSFEEVLRIYPDDIVAQKWYDFIPGQIEGSLNDIRGREFECICQCPKHCIDEALEITFVSELENARARQADQPQPILFFLDPSDGLRRLAGDILEGLSSKPPNPTSNRPVSPAPIPPVVSPTPSTSQTSEILRDAVATPPASSSKPDLLEPRPLSASLPVQSLLPGAARDSGSNAQSPQTAQSDFPVPTSAAPAQVPDPKSSVPPGYQSPNVQWIPRFEPTFPTSQPFWPPDPQSLASRAHPSSGVPWPTAVPSSNAFMFPTPQASASSAYPAQADLSSLPIFNEGQPYDLSGLRRPLTPMNQGAQAPAFMYPPYAMHPGFGYYVPQGSEAYLQPGIRPHVQSVPPGYMPAEFRPYMYPGQGPPPSQVYSPFAPPGNSTSPAAENTAASGYRPPETPQTSDPNRPGSQA